MLLGTDTYGFPIYLSDDERSRHIYVSGGTGAGKSNTLSRWIRDDLENGRPFAVLDPTGDLSFYTADSVPEALTRRTIYFDPLDTHVVGYNALRTVPIGQRSQLTADLVSTFEKRWADSWGPRMSFILGHAIRLLLDNRTNLLALDVLLTDDRYRARLLRKSTDPANYRYWTKVAPTKSREWADWISPILNKSGMFSLDSTLRAVVAQPSAINVSHLMNHRKFLIANLNKAMGDEPAAILGSFLTTAFAQAAQARSTIPESERQHFTVYVDEFQNFATTAFASILSEARKYRLNLVLANQHLSQIPKPLMDAVLGNAYTKVVFRVSAEDADTLGKNMGHPNPPALADTPNFHAWVRVGNGNAMLLKTDPKPPGLGRFDAVRAHTRAKHATPREMVEQRVADFFKRA